MRFLISIFFFSLCSISVLSQNETPAALEDDRSALRKQLEDVELTSEDRISTMEELGELYYGDSADSATYYLNNVLALYKVRNDSLGISRTFLKLSMAEVFLDSYEDALEYVDSTFQFSNTKDSRYFPTLGRAHSIEGIVYNNFEQMDVAFEKILQANNYLSKAPTTLVTQEFLIENFGDLALIYYNIEEYENAIASANKSLQLAEDAGIDYNKGNNYNMLGILYKAQDDFEMSGVYLDSAQMAFQELDYDLGLIDVASERGGLYSRLKEYNKAESEYKKALSISKEVDDDYLLTTCYLDLGHVSVRKNEITAALQYLDSANVYASKNTIPVFSGEMALLKSQIFEKENNLPQAIKELRDNVGFLETENMQESKMDAYQELYKLYKKNNDLENSLVYFEKYSNVKDSLRDQLQNGKLNVLRVDHNYNQIVSELEKTETQLKLANEEQRRIELRNTFLGIGAILIVGFSTFLFFRQKKLSLARRKVLETNQEVLNLRKKALDAEVRFKNKQITDFAIHISEKNELLEKIKAKLKKIRVTNDTYKAMVNDTLHFINNDIEQNKEKIQLYQHIDETTDSFGSKINQLYPELSEKEKKVAIMLRLGQTSKQIGLQLNISAASVDNYRYSLRKKMEIPKGRALKGFIQNL